MKNKNFGCTGLKSTIYYATENMATEDRILRFILKIHVVGKDTFENKSFIFSTVCT